MTLPGRCTFVSGTAVGATTVLLPGRLWTEVECANAAVAAYKTANGVMHQAHNGDCFAVLAMTAVAADPAQQQRSCFVTSASATRHSICTALPPACDSSLAPYGSPYADLELDLAGRALTGKIPTQLGVLTHLRVLDLSDNSLSGSIPSQIGMLTALTALQLAQNRLSGSVPSQLGRVTKLNALGLFDNKLRGSLPSQLGLLHPAFCYLLRRQRGQAELDGSMQDGNHFDCPLPTLYPGCGQNGLTFEGRVAQGKSPRCGDTSGLVSYTLAPV